MLISKNLLKHLSQRLTLRLKPKVKIRRCDLTSHPEVPEKYVAVLAEQKSIFPWYRWKEVIKKEENNIQGFAVFVQCPKIRLEFLFELSKKTQRYTSGGVDFEKDKLELFKLGVFFANYPINLLRLPSEPSLEEIHQLKMNLIVKSGLTPAFEGTKQRNLIEQFLRELKNSKLKPESTIFQAKEQGFLNKDIEYTAETAIGELTDKLKEFDTILIY